MKNLSLLISLMFVATCVIGQTTVNITPSKDNSIYSENANNSNGLGKLFSGRTNNGDIRRALIHFDIAGNVPVGATITAVSLDLNQESSGPGAGFDDYDLHTVTTDWGEGTSSGSGQGGPAVAPDATWTDAMFGTSTWTTPGGDFGASVATSTLGPAVGNYSWTSAGMVTDVQNWLDVPANNFGWILIGDEVTNGTARRFGSKDQGVAPVLNVTFTCTGTVTASCQGQTIYLDAAGNGTLNPSDLDNGSSSTCGGNLSFSASQTSFNCGDITGPGGPSLVISAVFDGPITGGLPKGIELYVINDIPDLSDYGVSSANNGTGPTPGPEFTFPVASATAGTYIYVATEIVEFTNYYGFAPDYTTNAVNINGNDAIELFQNGTVIDVFGDVNVDGLGEPWDYLDGWAYRTSSTGPDGSTFVLGNWTFSGPNAVDGCTTNASCGSVMPIGTYTTPPTAGIIVTLTVTDDFAQSDNCDASVVVLDTLPPAVNCITSGTFMLDGTGNLTLTTGDIDNGTTDNCALDVLSLSQTAFDCNDLGTNQVTLYATDIYGNIDSCTTTITVQDAGGFTVTVDNATDPSCFGLTDGSISITVSGGNPPYTFDWDNDGTGDFDDLEDLTNLGAGTYNIDVMDASGCITQETVTLNEPAEIAATFVVTDASCPGEAEGAIDMTFTGGTSPYTLDWDNDGTGDFDDTEDLTTLTAGDYIINILDNNGCLFEDTVTVADGVAPVLTVSVSGTTLTSDEPSGPYQWVFCPGFAIIPAETSQSITVPANGEYAVIVTSSTGCVDTSACVTVEGIGFDEITHFNVSISPNPASEQVVLQFTDVFIGKVGILDLNGKLIRSSQIADQTIVFDLNGLPTGVYFIEIVSEDVNLTKKLIVTN